MTTPTEITKKPLLSKVLWLFLIAMVLANTAGNMYGNILPLYLKSLGASVAQIGLFFTLFQILPLILQILGGWISDSLGRLRSIAMGSVAGVLSYVGLLLAPTWQWVFLGESLGAITRSLIGPSFGAFIAEESAEENRARVYGITQTIFAVVTVDRPTPRRMAGGPVWFSLDAVHCLVDLPQRYHYSHFHGQACRYP